MFTVKKSYRDLPAAHRQPNHKGHCRLIHGHNWAFDFVFGCSARDDNGFVVDVGELGAIKTFLQDTFDHTLLLNHDDPYLDDLVSQLNNFFAKIVKVPNCGMEALAEFVHKNANRILLDVKPADYEHRLLRCIEVTVWEDSKNSSTYSK
jgi:6-pyruvoyltetrahydropterin/6-carboxytetrahydropterin synthase